MNKCIMIYRFATSQVDLSKYSPTAVKHLKQVSTRKHRLVDRSELVIRNNNVFQLTQQRSAGWTQQGSAGPNKKLIMWDPGNLWGWKMSETTKNWWFSGSMLIYQRVKQKTAKNCSCFHQRTTHDYTHLQLLRGKSDQHNASTVFGNNSILPPMSNEGLQI